MADLNKLVEKIKADAELKKQFAQAVKENKVVEFCKNLGVEVTKEEIVSFIKSQKGELTDAEIDAVNGGCNSSPQEIICDSTISVFSAGIACSFASIGNSIAQAATKGYVSSCM